MKCGRVSNPGETPQLSVMAVNAGILGSKWVLTFHIFEVKEDRFRVAGICE